MGYRNGKYYCDQCGAVKGGINSKGWDVCNSSAICGDCLRKRKILKLQEKELEEAKKERKVRDKLESKQEYSKNQGSKGSTLLIVLKWIFYFIWGGPYLLFNGIKLKNKIWIIIGLEFTLFLILSLISVSFIKEGSNLYWINYIFIVPLLLNLIPLIYFYKYEK